MKVKSKKKSRRIHDQQLIINVLSISLARSPKKKNGPRWGPGTPPPISFFSGPVFSLIFAPFIFFSLSLSLSIFFFFRSSTHNSKRNRSERKKKTTERKKRKRTKNSFLSLSLFFWISFSAWVFQVGPRVAPRRLGKSNSKFEPSSSSFFFFLRCCFFFPFFFLYLFFECVWVRRCAGSFWVPPRRNGSKTKFSVGGFFL